MRNHVLLAPYCLQFRAELISEHGRIVSCSLLRLTKNKLKLVSIWMSEADRSTNREECNSRKGEKHYQDILLGCVKTPKTRNEENKLCFD
jgi:hypothetical protein